MVLQARRREGDGDETQQRRSEKQNMHKLEVEKRRSERERGNVPLCLSSYPSSSATSDLINSPANLQDRSSQRSQHRGRVGACRQQQQEQQSRKVVERRCSHSPCFTAVAMVLYGRRSQENGVWCGARETAAARQRSFKKTTEILTGFPTNQKTRTNAADGQDRDPEPRAPMPAGHANGC